MTSFRLGARLWWGLVPLVVLLWWFGAFAVAALPDLPSTPVATLVALPVFQFGRDIAMCLAVGSAAMSLLATDRVDVDRARRWSMAWFALWLALVAIGMVAIDADVAATGLLGFTDTSTFAEVITGTNAGRALIVQAVAAALALVLIAAGRSRGTRIAAIAIALIGTAAPGFAGHAGLSGTHAAAAYAIGAHIGAVVLWVGGLAAVIGLIALGTSEVDVILRRFSTLALVCVIVVAETGLLSATLTEATLPDLVGTAYGSLVLAKAALLAWLIRLGWQQRRTVIDALPDAGAVRTCVAIASIELIVMGTALAIAVVMSRIGPSPVPGSGFTALSLLVLGIAVPLVIAQWAPGGWRVMNSVPEVAAVVLLLVMVEVGGVGLLRTLLGVVGLILEAALLVLVGWWAVTAARGRRAAIVIVACGVPIALMMAALIDARVGG